MKYNPPSDKKIVKMAEKDAQEWLRAEMFYGDGAGVRRRHLGAEIEQKRLDFNGQDYYGAFLRAYEALDKNKFAKAAIKERKSIDRAAKAGRNLRALKSGNLTGLSTGVYIAVGAAIVAHQTGYDKKIEAEVKKQWARAKEEFRGIQHTRKVRRMKKDANNASNPA